MPRSNIEGATRRAQHATQLLARARGNAQARSAARELCVLHHVALTSAFPRRSQRVSPPAPPSRSSANITRTRAQCSKSCRSSWATASPPTAARRPTACTRRQTPKNASSSRCTIKSSRGVGSKATANRLRRPTGKVLAPMLRASRNRSRLSIVERHAATLLGGGRGGGGSGGYDARAQLPTVGVSAPLTAASVLRKPVASVSLTAAVAATEQQPAAEVTEQRPEISATEQQPAAAIMVTLVAVAVLVPVACYENVETGETQ